MEVFQGDVYLAVTLSVILLIIPILMKYLARNDDYWKKRGIPYGPRQSLWTIMKVLRQNHMHELSLESYRKNGRFFGYFEFYKPALQIAEPELLRDVLVKDFHAFPNRRVVETGHAIFDNQVSVLRGEDWKRVRAIITPAFTSKRMRQMGSVINSHSKAVIETFEKHWKVGKAVDCKRVFGAFTIDVIASAAFATKIDSQNDIDNIFVRKAKQMFQDFASFRIIFLMILPKTFLSKFGLKTTFGVVDFFKDTILQVIHQRKQSKERYNDMLQILMDATEENISQKVKEEHNGLMEDEEDRFGSIITEKPSITKNKSISEVEMLAQCVAFFSAGYDTAAGTMANIAYCLALNPVWQDKLIAEVDAAFQKHNEMSYDTLRDMKILDWVLSETLRMYPPLLISDRIAAEDYLLGNTGLIVEKGMIVSIPIYAIHHDPDYFEEPNVFNPERFADAKHPAYTYLPFGAGPRNCLGMRFALLEIKICLVNVLRYFRFSRAAETQVPQDFKKGFVLLSVDKLMLKVEKRTDVS